MSLMQAHLTPALLPNSHSKRSSPPTPMPEQKHHLYRNTFHSLCSKLVFQSGNSKQKKSLDKLTKIRNTSLPLFLQPKLKRASLSLYSNLEQFTV